MQKIELRIIEIILLISSLFMLSCSEEELSSPVADAKISLVDKAEIGEVISDANGMSLYIFSKDVSGESNCTEACLNAWPVFYMEDLAVTEGLELSDFSTITRADGAKQTTYQGWPLYYFASDVNPSDVKGEGVGSVWYAAKVDYTLNLAKQNVAGQELTYLVDAKGNSLYYFDNDTENESSCFGDCLLAYPSFQASSDLVIPSLLSDTQFSSFERTDGTSQLAFNGKPLYYFSEDSGRGDISGSIAAKWSLSAVQF